MTKPQQNLKDELPYVIINMAMSADGKTASANRKIHNFGSKHDLENLYKLRATADAVMCGARTAESPDVTLGTGGKKYKKMRIKNGLRECHIRIIVSGSCSLKTDIPVFKSAISPLIILTTESAPQQALEKIQSTGARLIKCGKNEVNFYKALKILKNEWNVNRLICEGGGTLNSALFRERLVDELNLTICPYILGGKSAPTIADGLGIQSINKAIHLELISKRKIENELFLRFKVC